MNNTKFKQIKCCIGNRFTTGYVCATGKQKESKNGKVYPVKNTTLYDIVEQLINNTDYRISCEEKANKYNKENNLTPDNKDYRKPKWYAKSIYSFQDYRYTKYDTVEIDGVPTRTLTNKSFYEHTGLMGFDIDFPKTTENLDEKIKWLKSKIFEYLKEYKWFCMVTLSTGGKGIHIYTYNVVPDYLSDEQRIAYFNSCYQYKSYFIYLALYKIYKEANKSVSLDFIFSLLDFAMYKPEQTINVTVYDNEPIINDNFDLEICLPVIDMINKGYNNWIHKEGNTLFPTCNSGLEIFHEQYTSITKFLPGEKYDFKNQGIFIKTHQKVVKKINGPFYFGHNERHDGIPTLHEICKYLLATRTYEEGKKIVEDPLFYYDNYSSKSECLNNISRLYDWYAGLGVEFIPNEYVKHWLNTNAGFKDELKYDNVSEEILNFYDGFVRTDKGTIDTIAIDNYIYYLENHPTYKNKLKYNSLFSCKIYDGRNFEDRDWVQIENDFNRHLKFTNKRLVENAVEEVCNKNKFNPVVDYLENLPEWDGIKRAENIFIDWVKCEDRELYKKYAYLMLYSAIKRVYIPGCKVDYCVVLQGVQGDGKSEFLERLSNGFFTENQINLDNKDYVDRLNKVWFCILDEMSAFDKKEMPAVKSFITAVKDDARLAYGRETKEYYRHNIFVGTTNKKGFLKDTDDDYERRFWVVPVNIQDRTYIHKNFTKETVNQIWAEMMYYYKQNPNEEIYLGNKLYEESAIDQRQFKSYNNDDDIDLLNGIFSKEYYFPNNSPTYKGCPFFTDYNEFVNAVEGNEYVNDNDKFIYVKSKCSVFKGEFIRRYLQEKWRTSKSGNYIALGTHVKYKLVAVYHDGNKEIFRGYVTVE